MSAMRMIKVSILPPKYAAASPSARPSASASTVLTIPTVRLMRRP